MRMAIGQVSDGEIEYAEKICRFVREIYMELTLVAPKLDDSSDMRSKMEVMLQSVMKIENGTLLFINLVPLYLSELLKVLQLSNCL